MKYLLIGILLFSISSKFSQKDSTKSKEPHLGFRKNIIYGNFGLETYTFNYERTVLSTEIPFLQSLSLHLGIAKGYEFEKDYIAYHQFTLLATTGVGDHHFIYEAGLVLEDKLNDDFYNSRLDDYNYAIENGKEPKFKKPNRFFAGKTFRLGYRYLKPQGRLMFNIGVGFPDFLFIGAGLSF
jgi:hypothetical protein